MIDRKAREHMAKVIRSYMDEEIDADHFDFALEDVKSSTGDETVLAVSDFVWFLYGDLTRKIDVSKEDWQYLNRLLLLLESDGEIEIVEARRERHPLQLIAALLLGLYVVVALQVGFDQQLLIYAIPFGPPSMLIAWLHSRRTRPSKAEVAMSPFPSISSILATRRRVRGFVRRRYPPSVAARSIAESTIWRLLWIPWSIVWCVFSPVALFFQMFPASKSESRITMPESLAGACEHA
jgi:hypothetical protein